MAEQRIQSDPNVIQDEPDSGQCSVQVEGSQIFDPHLTNCSVWWLEVRDQLGEAHPFQLIFDREFVTVSEVEGEVRKLALARGQPLVLWLCYERGGTRWERKVGWAGVDGLFCWSAVWRDSAHSRDVIAQRKREREVEESKPIGSARIDNRGDERPVDAYDFAVDVLGMFGLSDDPAIPWATHKQALEPMVKAWKESLDRGKYKRNFISIWDDPVGSECSPGTVPSFEIYTAGYERWQVLRIVGAVAAALEIPFPSRLPPDQERRRGHE